MQNQWIADGPASCSIDSAIGRCPSYSAMRAEETTLEVRRLNMVAKEFVGCRNGVVYFCDGCDEPFLKRRENKERLGNI